jgi:hypothetical protein
MLSNKRRSKFGHEGFLLTMPRMPTSCVSVCSYPGTSVHLH